MLARAIAPATLSNLGPGFDVLGLALETPLDAVTVELREEPGITVVTAGAFGDRVPRDPERNLAAFAAAQVLAASGQKKGGLLVTVEKAIPPGSGLGSSAASAAAAAVAAMRVLEIDLVPRVLLRIGRESEALAAGSPHLDNFAPALLGGCVAVVSNEPPEVRSLMFPRDWWFAVVLPDHPVETKVARAALPASVSMRDAVANLRDLAAVLDAAARADLPAFCAHLRDHLASPHRAPLWPFFDPARRAAEGAGAPALCISGSGPAMFAPCEDQASAERIGAAIVAGLAAAGYTATRYASKVSARGALGG